jgi:hypothetical protein
MTNDAAPLACYITVLDELIAGVAKGGLAETTALLKIARLDLLMRVYGISNRELQYALDTIEGNQELDTVLKSKAAPRSRPRLVHSIGRS